MFTTITNTAVSCHLGCNAAACVSHGEMLHGVHDMYVQVMGINVQPLLAVGGVSGIAIGFGAQSVSANAITGINLVSAVVRSLSGRPVWQ